MSIPASAGLPGLSIAWGAWAGSGMAAASGQPRAGFALIEPEQGLRALERLMAGADAYVAVLPADWEQLRQDFPGGALPPLLAELVTPSANGEQPLDFARRWRAARPDERRPVLIDGLRILVGRIAKLDPARVDVHQPLNTLGLDSLMAVELRNRLRAELEVDLALNGFLDGSALIDIAETLESRLTNAASSGESAEVVAEDEWVEGEL